MDIDKAREEWINALLLLPYPGDMLNEVQLLLLGVEESSIGCAACVRAAVNALQKERINVLFGIKWGHCDGCQCGVAKAEPHQ